jgi:hypothetical protein
LDGIEELSEKAAECLSRLVPEESDNMSQSLSLDGLKNLSLPAANHLAILQSPGGNDFLSLCGLQILTEDLATTLSNYEGSLILDGVKELSESMADALSRNRGDRLSLDGLEQLSDEVAAGLYCVTCV